MIPDLLVDPSRDPLGVLGSTRGVVQQARLVHIDRDALAHTAAALVDVPAPPADWSAELHPVAEDPTTLANLVLVVDALNFCFWNVPGGARPRWRVTYGGQTYDGYWALAAALRRAREQGVPLHDGDFLAAVGDDDVAAILRGDPGSEEIPLLAARAAHLREVGAALRTRWQGRFACAVQAAAGSASRLVQEVLAALPCFRDIALRDGREIRFYKRAQILVADLHGAFAGAGLGAFADLHGLTAFADYKVPQVLRRFGVLVYEDALAAAIARYALIPPGSDAELEIRAATIWGVELLRQALAQRDRALPSYAVDWALWRAGQALPADAAPYHRTRTVYY
jgi:hypothetical protein